MNDTARRRVLLLVQDVPSMFDTGIAQQVYFTRRTLVRAGCSVDVGGVATAVAAYRVVGIDTLVITEHTDITQWDLVVFVTTNLDYGDEANRVVLARWKHAGVRLVQLLCGNYCYLLLEQFTLGVHAAHGLARGLYNPMVDEYWMLETYVEHRQLLEALLGRPVRVLPYCWNSDVIALHARANGWRPTRDAGAEDGGLVLLVAEPNVSVHKSALVPVMIADGVNRALQARGRDDLRCLVMAGKKLDHALLGPFLAIYQQGRVEAYPRITLLKVLDELRAKRKRVVFVCHHVDNGLNFLHFEALALGYPVVHNSGQLRDTGHFYPRFEVADGVAAALAAIDADADQAAARRQRDRAVMADYDPVCARVVDGHREVIARLLAHPAPTASG